MKRKAIILDVDGTLWDSTSCIAQSYKETMKRLKVQGKALNQETIKGFMGCVTEEIAAIVFPDLSDELRMEYINQCMEEECAYLRKHAGILYDDVVEVLAKLAKKTDLYIVSNCQEGYIETVFASYPIAQYIKDYECSGHTGLKKGDNIRLIMKRNDILDAVYVGDTMKDKEATIEAGIPFVYASYGFGEVEEYDQKIDSFKELLDL